MATYRLPILGVNTIPDSSGNVFFEPYSVKATNYLWSHLVAIFNDTATRIGLKGQFAVPQNYVGTAKLVLIWSSTATTGDVEWDFDYRAVGGNNTESMDQATAQETVNGNDTAPTATDRRLEFSIDLTSGNFAIGDTVEFELFRDGTDAGDTMAAAAILFDAYFEYADV